jgi:uncharacterized protein (TIGR02145 family)
MTKSHALLLLFLIINHVVFSQVTTNAGKGDAKIQLDSYTLAEIDSMQNVMEGRMILNSTTNCINYFSQGRWFALCGNCLPETPLVKIDSSAFYGGRLFVYFDDKAAIDAHVEQFKVAISPFNWNFIIKKSPFVLDIKLDSTYAQLSLSGIGKCGIGPDSKIDSILLFTDHPCMGQTVIIDVRDNKSYPLIELGNQCWINGYLKYVPEEKVGYLKENKAVFYNWNKFSERENNFCPAGFHVPTKLEADYLLDLLDNPYNLFSGEDAFTEHLNEFGVEFIGGYDGKKNSSFNGVSDFFWTQQLLSNQDAYLGLINQKGAMLVSVTRNSYMPIRCIKN